MQYKNKYTAGTTSKDWISKLKVKKKDNRPIWKIKGSISKKKISQFEKLGYKVVQY